MPPVAVEAPLLYRLSSVFDRLSAGVSAEKCRCGGPFGASTCANTDKKRRKRSKRLDHFRRRQDAGVGGIARFDLKGGVADTEARREIGAGLRQQPVVERRA